MKNAHHSPRWRRMAGFTLVEMVIVIVITGILAAIVAIFIRAPVQGYFDTVRRAELTDQADLALRRITRDVRLALPNSVRLSTVGNVNYIEFIMTRSGGRYRDVSDGSTGGDFLSFTNAADLSFDVHGPLPAMTPGLDFFVVFNLGPGNTPANAYATGDACANCNRARITGVAGNTVTLANNPFASQAPPLSSPNGRFQVVPGDVRAVTYSCPVVGAAAGNLTRHWNYGFFTAQPTPPGGNQALLATGANCAVSYAPALGGRHGLLEIRLSLSAGAGAAAETVVLQQQIRVDNAP
ncbi:MAG: type II secretion system protein [Hylemonella sp.]|uniref:type II secretion system protein n=1 Tax=Hylemonella sp. TaxID=2066020 RepID=UPI0022BBC0DB|nr:type II secretion system protein [Hylemonella sp.]MCZ8251092.1 type II secretion system protein [Hylemonella sp.]